ncbi:hypothetical protein H6G81_34430 [Scytonema hofmannii FACHB-248]|uniref:Uncharacterized protein n=1 Tax=Scytonema hofmannii FACHB-248 TaxID=1842502 RepID=A0ABR8H172_9CYAN|nr:MULTISPECIES: hypothetical protein [Nostocales]MBD2609453.1 hypothetical protein [Scytonema hofmannii FACHB-248]
MAKKGQKLGPRATVVFGTIKTVNPANKSGTGRSVQYSYMRKSTAEFFGLKPAPDAKGVKGKNGRQVSVKGSKGSGSIKIPVGSGTGATPAAKAGKGKIVYKSIPVPSGANIDSIKKFIGTFTKNKPDSFVTKDGQTWPVGTKTK